MAAKDRDYSPLTEDDDIPQRIALSFKAAKLWRLRFSALLGVFICSLITVGLSLYEVKSGRTCHIPSLSSDIQEPYSPATGEIEYTNKWLARDPETHRFIGKPRPELDEAWHDLLQDTMIRVTEEELLLSNNATSVRHKDGGYIAGLGISHSLHCVKLLKQYLHPDYYYTSPDEDWDELQKHADHCLEALRQMVMCQADLSIYTLEWTPHSRVKPVVRVPQAHVCINWERIHDWMRGRSAGNLDMVPPPPELYEQTDDVHHRE